MSRDPNNQAEFSLIPRENHLLSRTKYCTVKTRFGTHVPEYIMKIRLKMQFLQGLKPATFIQRLPNVFQTPWMFGARWVVAVQTSLVH